MFPKNAGDDGLFFLPFFVSGGKKNVVGGFNVLLLLKKNATFRKKI